MYTVTQNQAHLSQMQSWHSQTYCQAAQVSPTLQAAVLCLCGLGFAILGLLLVGCKIDVLFMHVQGIVIL